MKDLIRAGLIFFGLSLVTLVVFTYGLYLITPLACEVILKVITAISQAISVGQVPS